MCLSEALGRLTQEVSVYFSPRVTFVGNASYPGVWNPFLRADGWNFCLNELCEAVIAGISLNLLL